MKKISIIFAALGLFVAASCSKINISTEPVEPQRNLAPLVIFSGDKVDNPLSKTSLNGTAVHWTADDVVAVFDKGNYRNEFKAVSVNGSKARFEGLVEAGTTEFYAVYPYQHAVSADNSNMYLKIPSDQTPADGTFAEELNLSVARGIRTPEEDEVAGLKFRNICGVLYFTVPERLAQVSNVRFTASNRMLSGDVTVSKSDDPAITKVNSGSNSVSMSGSFKAGSTFYFVVAPGDIAGFSIEVTTANGARFSKTSTKTITVAAGALKNLGTIDFKSEPTAVAEHTYENDILTGTNVTFNLGLPEKMEQYVENMQVSMYDSNETEVRNLVWDNPVASTTLSVVGNNLYLPQGDYTVKCTYTLNGVDEVKTFLVEVNAPVIRATASAYTSYSKYLQNKKDEANGCQPETIYDVKYSINVSDAVLAQYPMTSCSGAINDANGSAITPVSSATDPSMLKKSTFYSQAEQKVTNWGTYTAKATVSFDGVTVTSETINLHITGLPYSVSFAGLTSAPAGWNVYGGIAWTGYGLTVGDKEKYLRLKNGNTYNDRGRALSPAFYLPASINATVTTDCYYYKSYVFAGSQKIYVNANTSACLELTTNDTDIKGGADFNNFNSINDVVNHITLSTANPHVSITHNIPSMTGTFFMGVKSVKVTY